MLRLCYALVTEVPSPEILTTLYDRAQSEGKVGRTCNPCQHFEQVKSGDT